MVVRLLTAAADGIVRDVLTRAIEPAADLPPDAIPSRPAFERSYVLLPHETGVLGTWRDVTLASCGGHAEADGDSAVRALRAAGGYGAFLHNHPHGPEPSASDVQFSVELSRKVGQPVPGVILGHIVPFVLAATQMVYQARAPPSESEGGYRLFRAVAGLDPAAGRLVPGPYGSVLATLYDAVGVPIDVVAERRGFDAELPETRENRLEVVIPKLAGIYMRGTARVARAYVPDADAVEGWKYVPISFVPGEGDRKA